MDIKIENGDIVLLPNKTKEELIYDKDEIFQRMKILLYTKKGSFIYDRNMGTEYDDINISTERGIKSLCMRLNESLVNIEGASVEIADATIEDNNIKLCLLLSYFDECVFDEVIIDGQL